MLTVDEATIEKGKYDVNVLELLRAIHVLGDDESTWNNRALREFDLRNAQEDLKNKICCLTLKTHDDCFEVLVNEETYEIAALLHYILHRRHSGHEPFELTEEDRREIRDYFPEEVVQTALDAAGSVLQTLLTNCTTSVSIKRKKRY